MPSLAKRPCTEPGCRELVSSGKCAAHQRQAEPVRATTAERGYDAAHKQLRVQCFLRDGWRCVDCGWEPGIVKLCREVNIPEPAPRVVLEELRRAFGRNERHLHADHQVPIEQREDMRLDLDNLKTRCNVCHSRKTNREDGGFGARPQTKSVETAGKQAVFIGN